LEKNVICIRSLKIYKVLNQDEVFATRAAFDPLKCKQIVWAMFEDSSSFFWKRISPMDLAEGKEVEAIRSMLDNIIPVYVPPTGLPPTPAPPGQQQFHTPMSFLSPYSGVFGPDFGVPPPPPPPPGVITASLATKIAHVAAAIKVKFAEYHKKYGGRVLLSRLLQLGNIDITKLPVVPELVDVSRKNNLCYNFCLGVCPHGDKCHYKKLGGHIPGYKLSPTFVASGESMSSHRARYHGGYEVEPCLPIGDQVRP
jgi:hypothetical protein